MEARCKNCDKLFRVPDERFSGKGIKFACTRCGEYVIITQEEFQDYFRPKNAAAAPDTADRQSPLPGARAPESIKQEVDAPAPKPSGPSGIAPLEVRCSACNKLFRVPKEKFSGKGIRFACTRCGEYVIVTRQEFEQYFLSEPAAPAHDHPLSGPKAAGEPSIPEHKVPADSGPAPDSPPPSAGLSFQKSPAAWPEEQLSPFEQPMPPTHGMDAAPAYGQEQAFLSEPKVELEFVSHPRQQVEPALLKEPTTDDVLPDIPPAYPSGVEPGPLPEELPSPFEQPSLSVEPTHVMEPVSPHESETVPARPEPEVEPEHQLQPGPADILTPEPRSEMEQAPRPKIEPAATISSIPEMIPAAPREPFSYSPAPPPILETPIREALPSGSPKASKKAVPAGAFSLAEKALLSFIVLVIISVVGYGLFTYFQSSEGKPSAVGRSPSMEGLQIKNVTSSKDARGDILIEGAVENTSDQEKAAWYIVVKVYDAQGGELDKLRLLNGKQLYSRRDYEILEKRGVNVQALKAKNLEEQGVVIPAKGSTTFVVRYVQPSENMASTTPMLHPFDPVRLFKEIAADNK